MQTGPRRPSGVQAPSGPKSLTVVVAAVVALVLAVLAPVFNAARSYAADNPGIVISDIKVEKLDNTGGIVVPGPLYLWNYAKLSFAWDASAPGVNLTNGDSFWLELPSELRPLVGGVTPIKLVGESTEYGRCEVKAQKILCTFNEKVDQQSGIGYGKFKGNGSFEVQAIKTTNEQSLPINVSTTGPAINVPLPPGGNGGIQTAPYAPSDDFKKSYNLPQAGVTSIAFTLGFGTEKLAEKFKNIGFDKPIDGNEVHELVFKDTMAPGLTFIEDLSKWKLELVRDKNNSPAATLATAAEPNNGFSIDVQIGPKTAAGSTATIVLRGPLAPNTNYILSYRASVDGPDGQPQSPVPGVKYENTATLETIGKNSTTEAVYYNNSSVTIQMEPGFGTFSVQKSAQGPGSQLLPANKEFPVQVKWTLPQGATIDSYPNWSAPKGTIDPGQASGTSVMTAKLGDSSTFDDGEGRNTFPTGTTIELAEDVSGVPAPDGYEWGTPRFSKSTFPIGEGAANIVQVQLENPLMQSVGTFKVKKTASGAAAANGKEFTFAYDCAGVKGEVTATANGEAVVAGKTFPVGTKCTVEEKVDGTDIEGHELNRPAPVTVTISKQPEVVEAVFDNAYQPIVGDVVLTKVDGADANVFVEGAEFGLFTKSADGEVGDQPVSRAISGRDGVVTFRNVSYGTYVIRELAAAPGYQLTDKTWDVKVVKQGQTVNVGNVTNDAITGSVSVVKVEAGNPDVKLKGAVFVLEQGGKVVYEATSGEDGVAKFAGVRFGKYTLKEKQAPAGFQLSGLTREVEVKSQGQVVEVGNWDNAPITGSVSVVKVEAGNPDVKLKGAVFVLEQGGKAVYEATSGEDGVAKFAGVRFGKYTLKEKQAPAGFQLSGETREVEVKSQGQVIELGNWENSSVVGSVSVVKVEAGNPDVKLKGAVFVLEQGGKVVYEATSGEDGVAKFAGVRFGKYTLKEKQAPAGFQLSGLTREVEVKSQGQVVEVGNWDNAPITGSVSVVKVEAGNPDVKLKGAVFVLEQGGKAVYEATSGEDGVAKFAGVRFGKYTLKEKQAPAGFQLSGLTREVEVKSQGQVVEVGNWDNAPITGSVSVVKVEAGNPDVKLKGAVFVLEQGGKAVYEATSGEDGVAKFAGVRFGKYTLKEKQAPAGFQLSGLTREVEVKSQGQVVEVGNWDNAPITGSVSVVKVEAGNPDVKLKGAVFVLEQGGKAVYEATSGEDGVAKFAGVRFGKYTLKEKQAPAGFQLSGLTREVEVKSQGQVVEVGNWDNAPITGSVSVVKVEAGNPDVKLKGAVFVLEQGGKAVYEATSGEDGVAKFAGVRFGKYTLKEKQAPAGFQLSGLTREVEVKSQGQVVEVGNWDNAPITGSVRVVKVDAENPDIKLAGVVFVLKQGAEAAYEATTDKDGVAVFENVRFGTYQLVETKTLENYVLDGALKVDVNVETQDQVIEIGQVKNHMKKANVAVVKKGSDSALLSGAEFELRQGEKVVAKATSGADGKATFANIPWGEYTLVETKAPAGYKLIDKPVSVRVAQDGGVVEVGEIVNQKIPEKPSPTPTTPGKSGKGGKLAKTGIDMGASVPWMLALLAAGTGLLFMRKRRS